MTTVIDLTDPAQIENKLKKEMNARIKNANKAFAADIADFMVDAMKNEVESGEFYTMGGTKVKGAFNTGELNRSITRVIKDNVIIVGAGAAHAKDVEYGLTAQEAKQKVEYQDILQWVKDKRFTTPGKAKYVARKILKYIHDSGISHRPFFRRGIASTQANVENIKKANASKYKKIFKGESV